MSVAMCLPSRVAIIRSVATLMASYCFGEDFQPDGGMRDGSGAVRTVGCAYALTPVVNAATLNDTASTRTNTCMCIRCILGKS